MSEQYMQLTYLGHGSVLIRHASQVFLTDPNFSEKVLFSAKRLQAPGICPQDLPAPSAILVSNACYDHLDIFSYKYFSTRTSLFAPKGAATILQKFLPNPVTEISNGGRYSVFGHQIHAFPVKKSSFRWLPWMQRGACAFLIESNVGKLYFTGDTAYGPHFKELAKNFNIDIALLPLGSQKQRSLFNSKTLEASEWLEAAKDLGAKHALPIRWGTFQEGNSDNEASSAIEQLQKASENHDYAGKIHFWNLGEELNVNL